ncbi:hypothetical protein V6246_06610 [Algibacter sp. TI.3.09]|uniref:hypothetical protein n=1 Tax=Algibacter sp. TI.3.09 TaxID=3121298 RepID=UPI00311E7130
MESKKVIFGVTALLVLANLLTITFFDLEGMRNIRLISSSSFLILFVLLKGYKNIFLLLALISLVFADFFIHFFETLFYARLTLVFRGLAAICVCLDVLPKIIRLKYNVSTTLVFFVVALLHVFLLFKLLNLTQVTSKDSSLTVVALFYGALQIFLAILAFAYSYGYSTVKARYYVVFVYGVAISNVLTSTGYFLGFDFLFYVSRPLYVLGLGALLVYSVVEFKIIKPLEI